jgi:Holliday junction resolvase RusA-like endonuclease
MKAIIHFKGTPRSKQHGHKSFTNKNTGKIHFYSTTEYTNFKTALGWESAAQLRRQGWIRVEEDPVWISVMFKANHNVADISNVLGGIEDALNGLAWADDCQALIRTCYGIMTPGQEEIEFTVVLENFEGNDPCADGIRAWVRDGLKRRRKRYDKQDKVRGIPGRASRLAPA